MNRERGAVVVREYPLATSEPVSQRASASAVLPGAPLSRSARFGRLAITPGGNVLERLETRLLTCGICDAGRGGYLAVASPAVSHGGER